MTNRLVRIVISNELACGLLGIPGGRVRAALLNTSADVELTLEHESFAPVAPGLIPPMRSVLVTTSNGAQLPDIRIDQ